MNTTEPKPLFCLTTLDYWEAVTRSDLPTTARLLAFQISWDATVDGIQTWPPIPELAARIKADPRVVRRYVRMLQAAGWLPMQRSTSELSAPYEPTAEEYTEHQRRLYAWGSESVRVRVADPDAYPRGSLRGYLPRLIASQDGICGICRQWMNPSEVWPSRQMASIDHIIPITRGGSDNLANLQAAHLSCNVAKGNRL